MVKDLEMLIAHPDDEVIFGWPVLERARRIVSIVSDKDNADRKWCSLRSEALIEVGKIVGAEVVCLNFNSEFYRLTTRDGQLWDMVMQVQAALGFSTLPLFTHNPWGEYGHVDHILAHQIGLMTGRRLLVTDMATHAKWMPVVSRIPGEIVENPREMNERERELYKSCSAEYLMRGCWTWSQEPITKAGLYAIDFSRLF